MTALSDWLGELCSRRGLWTGQGDLVRRLTGASFPLLALLYDTDLGTLGRIPRWAAPALRAPSPRPGARAVLGSAASRRVVAALSASLLPQGPVPAPPALHPMALAIMGAPILPPDGLVRVLQAGTHDRQPPPDGLPTIDDITRFRLVVCELGATRVERILTDAASRPDGPRLLSETAELLGGLPAGARGRLPTRLDALHQRCRELTPVDPRPRADATPAVAGGRAQEPAMRRRHTAPGHALAPPPTRRVTPASPGGLSYSPAIWRLHGAPAGPRLRLALPRSVHEIRVWGQRLHNCLGTYAGAAVAGESLLIGVERLDVLTYCAEVNPRRRTLRQLLGPYNRSVSPVDAVAVCAVLLEHRLLDPQQPTNRPWMELCRTLDPDRMLAQT